MCGGVGGRGGLVYKHISIIFIRVIITDNERKLYWTKDLLFQSVLAAIACS